MVALGAGLAMMLALLPRFGLKPPDLSQVPPIATPLPVRPTAAPSRHALPARLALLAVLALLFGAVNSTFAAYDKGTDQTDAVVRPVIGTITELGGWGVTEQHDILVGKPYFGSDSVWTRYRLNPIVDTPKDQQYTIWVDSVTANDRRVFDDFGIEKCYRFHGSTIDAAEPVTLGAGVVGSVIAVTRSTGAEWVVLWWEWPVKVNGKVRHERVVLLASTKVRPQVPSEQIAGKPLLLFDTGTPIPPDLKPLADGLTAVASGIVTQQTTTVAAAK
jgi:hypothetical protein